MKKTIIILIFTLVLSLTACRKELEYPCNEQDEVFINFFGDLEYTISEVNIGKLNQCNNAVDTLESATNKIDNLKAKIEEKESMIHPDISAFQEYISYESNHRYYHDDLIHYDIFDTYSNTTELEYIAEVFMNVDIFTTYYDNPEEGKLNNVRNSDEFYKLRYYVNSDYLYYVQYHNESGSQFTVSRIYFDEFDKLYFDEVTYYGEDANYTYSYIAYEEGVGGLRADYKEYEKYRGILYIQQANFEENSYQEYYLSNYADHIFRYNNIDADNQQIIRYTEDPEGYFLSLSQYNDNGFVYGRVVDTRNDLNDYRFNIEYLDGWDYYFQHGLYHDETLIEHDTPMEVVVRLGIGRIDGYLQAEQQFELVFDDPLTITTGPQTNIDLPSELTFTEATISDLVRDMDDQYEYAIPSVLNSVLGGNDLDDRVELLEVWKKYVPEQFYLFVNANK